MFTPELLIVSLNISIVLAAYFSVYPKLAGSNLNRIAFYDIFATGLALGIVGFNYWGTGHGFSLLSINLNWFWYTFVTYLLAELPVMFWYFKKHNVKFK